MSPEDELLLGGEEFDKEVGRLDSFLKKLFSSAESNSFRVEEIAAQRLSPDSSDFVDQDEAELKLLEAGTKLGRFTIRKWIGFGGFGMVYHAVDEQLGFEVALKVPRQDRMNSSQVLRRFNREARLAKGLEHPSIVRVIEASMEGDTFYIASEFQNGPNLKQWVEANPGPVDIDMVVGWGIQLAEALQYAFLNGIVHRDLKPTNIMIVSGESEGVDAVSQVSGMMPKITDFGLAYSVNEPISSTSVSGMLIGTPGYMAPEQVLSGKNRVDIRADVYALGLILAELLAGERIRKFDHLMEFVVHLTKNDSSRDLDILKKTLPVDLHSILLKSIDMEPDKRYQTPRDLLEDLQRFQRCEGIQARPISRRERTVKFVRQKPYQAALVAISIVFMIVFVLNQWMNNRELMQKEDRLVRLAYNSSIRLGFSELRDGRMESAHEILDNTRMMKRTDGSLLKDFSWSYLHQVSTLEFNSHRIDNFRDYLNQINGEVIQATYDKHKEFILNKSMIHGNVYFKDQSVRFEGERFSMELNDSIFAIFRDRDSMEGVIEYDGSRLKHLEAPYAYFLYSPDSKKMIYFKLDQVPKSDPIHVPTGLISFDTGFQRPRMSLDGHKITCLLKSGQADSPDYSWSIYDTQTGEMMKTGVQMSVQGYAQNAFAGSEISQNGRLAVFYGVDTETIHVFDTNKRKIIHSFGWPNPTGKNHPQSLAIDEIGGRILVGDSQNRLYIMKIGDAKPYREFKHKFRAFHQVGFFPDGRVYGNWAYSDRIWFWDPDQPLNRDLELDHTKEVWSLAFDPLGETLVSTGDDHSVRVWNLKTQVSKQLELYQSLVTCGKFSPDSTLFAACDFSGCLKVWDAKTWKLLKTTQITEQKLRSLAWSPDSRSIVCVGGREIIIYKMSEGQIQKLHSNGVMHDVLFSKSGDEIVVSEQNDNGSLLFLGFPSGKRIKELVLNRTPTRMVLSPDGDTIAVGYNNGGIGVIGAETRKIQKHVGQETGSGDVWSLEFTRDGKSLIASGADNRLIIYETETWEPLGMIIDHKSRVHALTVSQDGRKVAAGDMSGKIIVRDIIR